MMKDVFITLREMKAKPGGGDSYVQVVRIYDL